MQIGIVDIGSNSTRLVVADVAPDGAVDELERYSRVTRLGEGVDAHGHLGDEAIARVRAVLDDYAQVLDEHDVERRVAVLTSAVRDAANGGQLVDEVRDHFALEARVLSGDEEARLTFLGATSERDPDDRTPTVVIDVGGGSTELVVGEGRTATFHVSTQAGVVRQSERHLRSDPPQAAELDELRAEARELFAASVPAEVRATVRRAIGVAGSATSLAAIDQELDPYDPDRVEGHVLTLERCAELLDRLAALPLDRRRRVAGLHPDRAPVIVAGCVLLGEAVAAFGLDRFQASEHDLLRGAALAAAGRQDASGAAA